MSSYLGELEARFRDAWKQGLSHRGVPYPAGAHKWALLCLFEAIPGSRSQEQIAEWYLQNELGHYDRQLRHLAARKWPLVTGNRRSTNMKVDPDMPRGHLRLASMTAANPISDFSNRAGGVSKMAWEDKIRLFEETRGGCAVCGEKQSGYDKGHLDRSRGMVAENLVPMCTGCNNHAQAYDFDFRLHRDSLKARPVPRGGC